MQLSFVMDKQTVNKEGEKAVEPSSSKSVDPPADKPGQRRRRARGRKPADTTGDDPFAPRHLAPAGPVVNEPLSDKCFFPLPGEALASTSGEKNIYTGAEGLVPLATEEYTGLVAHTFSVKRSISLSGYCYYAACLTWARMVELDAKNGGRLTFDEQSFVEGCKRYKPPKILHSYLAGIGNTNHPNGFHDLRFRLKKPRYATSCVRLSFPGYFGKMKDFARYYASYPCIAVFALRIIRDLAATHEREEDAEWDLPGDFNYPDHPLTTSCIGYRPAQPVDRSILATYSLCGVTRNTFNVDSDSFAVNWSFLNEIQAWVEEVRGLVQLPFPISVNGSRGQLLEERIVHPRHGVENSSWQAMSPLRLSSGVEYAGSTFLYRVDKSPAECTPNVLKLYLPYVLAGEEPNWADIDLNFLRNEEEDDMLHTENGISGEFTLPQRLRVFMAANVKV